MHENSCPPERDDLPTISERVGYALRAWLRAKLEYRAAQDAANKRKGEMEQCARRLEEAVDEEQSGQLRLFN